MTLFGLAVASLLFVRASVAQPTSRDAAQTSARSWLALVDAKNYAASWDEAATVFKSAVTQATWETAVKGARTPLGELKMRTLNSATATTSPPGAPSGEYIVIKYDTTFDQKQGMVETVALIKQDDGTWRVAGYFVQ
ncbi:MAG TPA: DUF4019 domain-containing protein [Vicinamibacterales bacterium]|nr:DUF4019 domain-containing protein [Vicinamibacterales bacterium]